MLLVKWKYALCGLKTMHFFRNKTFQPLLFADREIVENQVKISYLSSSAVKKEKESSTSGFFVHFGKKSIFWNLAKTQGYEAQFKTWQKISIQISPSKL